jgi:hypothetical protein
MTKRPSILYLVCNMQQSQTYRIFVFSDFNCFQFFSCIVLCESQYVIVSSFHDHTEKYVVSETRNVHLLAEGL